MDVDGLGPTTDGMEKNLAGLLLKISDTFFYFAVLEVSICCTLTNCFVLVIGYDQSIFIL